MQRTDALRRAMEAAESIGKERAFFEVPSGQADWVSLGALGQLLAEFRGNSTICLALASQGGGLLLSPLLAVGRQAPLPQGDR